MPKLSSLAVFTTAATVLFGVGSWFLVQPQLTELSSLRTQQEVLQDEPIVTALSIRKNIQANNLEKTQELVNVLLPNEDNQYDLSVQIEGLADQLSLPLTGLVMNAEAKSGIPKSTAKQAGAIPTIAAKKVTLNIGVTGEYTRVQQFINSLPTLNRFIQIGEVVLTSGSADTTKKDDTTETAPGSAVNAQITAFAYYIPGPATPTN